VVSERGAGVEARKDQAEYVLGQRAEAVRRAGCAPRPRGAQGTVRTRMAPSPSLKSEQGVRRGAA